MQSSMFTSIHNRNDEAKSLVDQLTLPDVGVSNGKVSIVTSYMFSSHVKFSLALCQAWYVHLRFVVRYCRKLNYRVCLFMC